MSKRKHSSVRPSAVNIFDFDFSDESDSDYEPTEQDIAELDADFYDSDDGESIEEFEVEERLEAVMGNANNDHAYVSKDGKITFSPNPIHNPRARNMNSVPGTTMLIFVVLGFRSF